MMGRMTDSFDTAINNGYRLAILRAATAVYNAGVDAENDGDRKVAERLFELSDDIQEMTYDNRPQGTTEKFDIPKDPTP